MEVNGIPIELFQILKDDAVKVLHSVCQQIWKTQQWPQDWKRSVFIPIPKKGNAKECSTAATAAKSLQLCPTLCNPIDGSPPGSSVHGICQARVLDWGAIAFSILVCEMSAIVWQFEHSLALPFLGIRMKTDLFQSCGHCCIFQICWHIECSTLTAPSFRI